MSDIGVVVVETMGDTLTVAVVDTVEVIEVVTGVPGPSGTQIVAVPFASPWPPAVTQPNTLYLRLEP